VYRAIRERHPELSRFLRDGRIPETSFRSSRRVKGVGTREILTPTVRVGDIPLRGGYGAAGIEEQATSDRLWKILRSSDIHLEPRYSSLFIRTLRLLSQEKRYIYIYISFHIYIYIHIFHIYIYYIYIYIYIHISYIYIYTYTHTHRERKETRGIGAIRRVQQNTLQITIKVRGRAAIAAVRFPLIRAIQ